MGFVRVLLTIPVSVTSGERSFPKSVIKNSLRSAMPHKRLSSIATLSVEGSISQIQFPQIGEHVCRYIKVRKVKFH